MIRIRVRRLTGHALPRLYAFLRKTFQIVEKAASPTGELAGLEAEVEAIVDAWRLAWAEWDLRSAFAVAE